MDVTEALANTELFRGVGSGAPDPAVTVVVRVDPGAANANSDAVIRMLPPGSIVPKGIRSVLVAPRLSPEAA
jgi:hypothetical protein